MPINTDQISDFRGILGSRPSLIDRGVDSIKTKKRDDNITSPIPNNVTVKTFSSSALGLDLDGARHAYHPNDEGCDLNEHAGISQEEATRNEFRGKRGYGIAKYKPLGKDFYKGYIQPDGFFVSQTAIGFRNLPESNPEKWVDALTVPFLRVNKSLHLAGVRKGDIAYIINHVNGISSYALFADTKFTNDEIEISLALARSLEIPAPPEQRYSYDRRKLVTKYNSIANRPLTVYAFKNSGDGYAKTIEETNRLGEILKNKLLFKNNPPLNVKSNERLV